MEKFIKWSCFITSGCVVIVFIFALYIGTLLPDTFLVTAGGDIAIAGMPFVRAAAAASTGEVAGLSGGSSYNADLTIAPLANILMPKGVPHTCTTRRSTTCARTVFTGTIPAMVRSAL